MPQLKKCFMKNNNTNKNQKDMNIDLLVRVEKLELLYRQSFPATFVSFFVAIILAYTLWPVQQHSTIVIWSSLIAASSLLRLALFINYLRTSPHSEQVLKWERPYFSTLLLSSIIWGVGAVFIMPTESELHQAVIFFFLVGMSGGAISVYSAQRSMTLAAITTVLLPTTLLFLVEGKPFQIAMAVAAILFFISAVRAGKVLSQTMHQSFRLTHELEEAKEEAEKMALIDELTGLNNRRAFYEQGHVLTNLSQRSEAELSMIVMDLDHFKNVNDTLGHAAGDEALKKIGEVLKKMIRKSDVCARIGGEEFGILLQVTSEQDAGQLAEKLRKEIEQTKISFNGEEFSVTGSFGVSVCATSLEKLFKGADQAMYQAKDSGRNCVVTVGCVID